MTPESLILVYVLAGLAVVGGLSLWGEHRRRSFEPARDPDQVFRCDRCSLVYTDDPEVERSRCPGCGRTNEPFRFR